MTPLKGEAALALHQQLKERTARDRALRLQAAKVQAAERGKEAFDLCKLEPLYDTTGRGHLTDAAERAAIYEYMYYVEHPQAPNLESFARCLAEIDNWS